MIKQKNRSKLIFALPILTLVLLGCGLSGILVGSGPKEEPPLTRTPLPTFTPVADEAFIQVEVVNTQPEVIEPTTQPETQEKLLNLMLRLPKNLPRNLQPNP